MSVDDLKTVLEGSKTITNWSMDIFAACLLALISTSYLQPKSRKMRYIYLLFLPSWICLGLAIYYGDIISRRFIAAVLNPNNLTQIESLINDEYKNQLRYFDLALLFLAVWLVTYLIWWVFFCIDMQPQSHE